MPHAEATPQSYCNFLVNLPPEERHERLKNLQANDLFCAVFPLLPERLRSEFHWLEKRDYVQSNLKRPAVDGELERLMEREFDGLGPTRLKSLVAEQANDDELWIFQAFPGDKGYALVRQGCVIDFSIMEITTATMD